MRPAVRTFVVADDFWTGVVDLDERSIYGLSGEELEQRLRKETESMSNLDPSNSRMGFVELSSVPPDTYAGIWRPLAMSYQASHRRSSPQLLANPALFKLTRPLRRPWVEFTAELAGASRHPQNRGLPRAYVTRIGQRASLQEFRNTF